MAKTIFVSLPLQGHTNPTIQLVKILATLGEDITYITTKNFQNKFAGLEVKVTFFEELSNKPCDFEIIDPTKPFSYALNLIKLFEMMEAIHTDLLDYIKDQQPDYIIYDHSAYYGLFIAKILGIPHICSSSAIGFKLESLTFKDYIEFLQITPNNIKNLVIAHIKYLNLVYKGVVKLNDYKSLYNSYSELNFLYTVKDLQPNAHLYDDRFVYVGPSIETEDTKLPSEFDFVTTNPTIYFAPGSVLNKNVKMYELLFETCSLLQGYKCIVSIPNETLNKVKVNVPNNVITTPFAPQKALLKHTKLFVTFGGFNSINEGLYFANPLVVIPQTPEQKMNAKTIQKLGLGTMIEKQNLTSEKLHKEITLLIADQNVQGNLEEIKQKMHSVSAEKTHLVHTNLNKFKQLHQI